MGKNKKRSIAPGGAGFGGKKKPREDKESGISAAYAHIVYALGEGPIEGPIGWTKGIYLNETPVQNADGSFNFKNFGGDFRPGTSEQTPMAAFGDEVVSETPVNVEVKHNLPVTRALNNANIDVIRVRLAFQLQEAPSDGGVLATSIAFRIYIKEGSGPYQVRLEQEITARYSSPVEFERDFPVNNFGGTVTNFGVRVERMTPQDEDTTRYQRNMSFKAYGEVVKVKLSYPHTALLGMQYSAEQFDSLPTLGIKCGGRLIRIPTNSTVARDRGLDYSGVWDGNFYQAPIATSCPAWIFFDLLTNTRYGLGRYIKEENIDKWAIYDLSRYCNEMIFAGDYASDFGYGEVLNFERRFQCDVVLQNKEDATRVIDAFRSIFRGFAYWTQGVLKMEADRPGTPSLIVTQADIQDGMFTYTTTPLRSRHSVARVTWIDRENLYKEAIESVEDQVSIDKYGWRELDMSAFACVRRGQAYRAGWAALLSERLETETVRFRMRPYGAYLYPGVIIKVMDSARSEARFSGLVVDCIANQITIDHPVNIASGERFVISVLSPSGNLMEKEVFPMGVATGTTELLISQPFGMNDIPVPESPWILTSATVQAKLFRVLTVTQVSGDGGMMYECTALQYVHEKYTKIDTDYFIPAAPRPATPPAKPPVVLDLKATLEEVSVTERSLVAVWRKPNEFITGYIAQYRAIAGEWSGEVQSTYSSAAWTVPAGKYYVRVSGFDFEGRVSDWKEIGPIEVIQAIVLDLRISLDIEPRDSIALNLNLNLKLENS